MKQLCFPLLTSSYVVFSATSVLIATGAHANVFDNCKRVSPAVVTIYAGTEIGSGSILTQDGVVITNHHVLEDVIRSKGKKTIYVNLPNGGHYTAKLLSQDKPNDLALIRLNTASKLPTVPLADSVAVKANDPVCAIGSPLGRQGVLSQGKFSGYRENGDLRSQIFLYPGNSGGPLLDAQGRMIGINKSIWENEKGENSGISFATSTPIVRSFVTKSGIALAVPQPKPQVTQPVVAKSPPAQPVAAQAVLEPGFDAPSPASGGSRVELEPTPEWAAAPQDLNQPVEPARQAVSVDGYVVQTYPEAATVPAQPGNFASDRVSAPEPMREYVFSATPTPTPKAKPAPTKSLNKPSDGRLGVIINTQSLTVRQVEFDTPAERAGLLPGDRIVAVNNAQLRSFEQLDSFLSRRPQSAVFTIRRSTQTKQVRVNF